MRGRPLRKRAGPRAVPRGPGMSRIGGSSLIAAMERDGLGPQEILEVLKDPAKREELHGKYGIAA